MAVGPAPQEHQVVNTTLHFDTPWTLDNYVKTGGYEAWLPQEPTISTASPRLADLPSLIADKTVERWPTLVGRAIPGMLHWNRELTAGGFRDLPIPGTS